MILVTLKEQRTKSEHSDTAHIEDGPNLILAQKALKPLYVDNDLNAESIKVNIECSRIAMKKLMFLLERNFLIDDWANVHVTQLVSGERRHLKLYRPGDTAQMIDRGNHEYSHAIHQKNFMFKGMALATWIEVPLMTDHVNPPEVIFTPDNTLIAPKLWRGLEVINIEDEKRSADSIPLGNLSASEREMVMESVGKLVGYNGGNDLRVGCTISCDVTGVLVDVVFSEYAHLLGGVIRDDSVVRYNSIQACTRLGIAEKVKSLTGGAIPQFSKDLIVPRSSGKDVLVLYPEYLEIMGIVKPFGDVPTDWSHSIPLNALAEMYKEPALSLVPKALENMPNGELPKQGDPVYVTLTPKVIGVGVYIRVDYSTHRWTAV